MKHNDYVVKLKFTAYSEYDPHIVTANLRVTVCESINIEIIDFDIVGLVPNKAQELSIKGHIVENIERQFEKRIACYSLDDLWLYQPNKEFLDVFNLMKEMAA